MLRGPAAFTGSGILDLSPALIALFGWLRDWLDRLPDRHPSQLSLWGRLGRVVLAVVVSLAFCAPYVWIALKIRGQN